MRHAAQHARTRSNETRQRLAFEAARLMAESGIRDYQIAKQRAASRLGVFDEHSLPRNSEIEHALREYQRLFQSDSQPRALRVRREAAREAMEFFARFDPRLVGAVLEGSADEQSAICMHLFADDVESVGLFLAERGIPLDQRSRRLRIDRERSQEFPVFVFTADGLPFDLTVLPRDALRQPPRDPADSSRPMRRASLAALRALLIEEAAE